MSILRSLLLVLSALLMLTLLALGALSPQPIQRVFFPALAEGVAGSGG